MESELSLLAFNQSLEVTQLAGARSAPQLKRSVKIMSRKNTNTNSPYEPEIGFSRGVRIGKVIAISGTAPLTEDGKTAFPGDPYNQTKRCLEIIELTARNLGATLENTIRTRVYLRNKRDWEAIGKAHGEYFQNIQPACTFVEISDFLQKDWLVEIEADMVLET